MKTIGINLLRVIQGGGYRLSEMLEKIDLFYAAGNLTAGEREDLMRAAKSNLHPEQERPDLLEAVKRMEQRFSALENRLAALEGGGGNAADPDAFLAWHPWTGIPGSGYKTGAQVTHNGKRYRSIFPGENVWEPGALGTEGLWAEV